MIDSARVTFTGPDADLQPGHLRVRDVGSLRWWKERPTAARYQLDLFPTFDELWTLHLCFLAEAGPVPTALESVCLYAEDVKQGRWTDRVAPEHALQAIVLAVVQELHRSQKQLLEEVGALFDHVAAQVAKGHAVVSTPMDHPRFQRYVAALVDDQRLYREDLTRSQSWRVTMDHRTVKLLVLDRPAATQFKLWARRKDDAALMLVRQSDGTLVLSADPSAKLKVDQFAPVLSKLDTQPWYGGERHHGTLIASARDGTRLSFDAVRRAIGARHATNPRWLLLPPAVALGALLLIVLTRPSKPPAQPIGAKGDPLDPKEVVSLLQRADGPKSFEGYALVIGVCGYTGERALTAPCDDARAVRAMLTGSLGYAPENVLFFVDQPAPGEASDGVPDAPSLKLAVERFRERFPKAGPNSSFFFYYSGHGGYEKGARKDFGVLQPAGYFERPDEPMASRGWDMQELVDDLRKGVPSKHVMIVLDACYSGWAVGAKGEALLSPELKSLWNERAEVVLTAGTKGQRAWESEGHSLFTAALLDGMGGKADANADRVITDEELAAYARKQVALEAQETKHAQQTPQFFRFDESLPKSGQFLFVRGP